MGVMYGQSNLHQLPARQLVEISLLSTRHITTKHHHILSCVPSFRSDCDNSDDEEEDQSHHRLDIIRRKDAGPLSNSACPPVL